MNDTTRRAGWNAPAQQGACPNCAPQTAMAQPSSQMPFLSRGVQGMMANTMNGTNGMSALPPQPQFPSAESTSNYADLGMGPVAGTQTTPAIRRPGNSQELQSLVGGDPSSTELPGLTAINLENETTAYSAQNLQYLNGFLVTQIGKNVTVTFLIGSNSMDVRSGRLVGVGANYILINEFESDDVVACDFYSIKFVKIYY